MTPELVRSVLGWCTVINFGLLFLWLLAFALAGGWMHRFHSHLFHMDRECFNAIHYAGMAVFKMLVIVFNLVPYLALRIVG